jgi:hypothetical protein
VVDPHRLLVDVRLERGVVVGESWNLVRHRSLLRRLTRRRLPAERDPLSAGVQTWYENASGKTRPGDSASAAQA